MQAFGNVLIIGTGLMGGSLAKALRERKLAECVVGYSRRIEPLQQGVQLGILDAVADDLPQAISKADVIVLGVPTLAVGSYLPLINEHRKATSVVTDVASVKGDVVNNIIAVLGEMPAWFVPGHPIAGREQSGIEASDSSLYIKHKVILTPLENTDTQAVKTMQAMWQAVGADVVLMDVEEHDTVLAATSHLPHALAFVLVDTLLSMPQKNGVFEFAAGGFRDFTRIASSHPVMWHDIMLANKPAILAMLASFREHLGQLEQFMREDDSDAILALFGRAKAARDEFTELLKQRQKED